MNIDLIKIILLLITIAQFIAYLRINSLLNMHKLDMKSLSAITARMMVIENIAAEFGVADFSVFTKQDVEKMVEAILKRNFDDFKKTADKCLLERRNEND